LFADIPPTEIPEQPEMISLNNPIEENPSLILMTTLEPGHTNIPLFTHDFKIRHELTTLVLENRNQKNHVSKDLVQHLQLPTTPHPDPYQLVLVKIGGPRIIVARCSTIAFSIGPFRDIMVCDIWCLPSVGSPLPTRVTCRVP
jgi:hypothetical protein